MTIDVMADFLRSALLVSVLLDNKNDSMKIEDKNNGLMTITKFISIHINSYQKYKKTH